MYNCAISEKDEEVNKKFHVNKVDLNIKSNTEDHHTDKYMCTKRKKDPDFVIRRGQSFKMTITFDRPYNNEQNEILFTFKTGNTFMYKNYTVRYCNNQLISARDIFSRLL